ncbi:MAG: 3'-5' exonuclease [Verrucomicrobiota bacterium JB022]|nr:3'-5' exonuclease [Verrucomicrobiota bacterium JB022]
MDLFLDTETTGLASTPVVTRQNFLQWPRVIAVAWLLVDAERNIRSQQRLLIRPDGFKVPGNIQLLTGLAQHQLEAEGIPIAAALERLEADLAPATQIIGHNLRFDLNVLASERLRRADHTRFPPAHLKLVCTLHLASKSREVRKQTGLSGRIPLRLLYAGLMGREIAGHHDPLQDALACRDIYYRLQDLRPPTLPKP